MDRDAILQLNVNELKQKLGELGLLQSGLKVVLQKRLLEHFNLAMNEEYEDLAGDDQFEEAIETPTSQFSQGYQCHFTLRDIQDSLNCSNGTNRPCIETWLREFEDGSATVGWNEVQKFIFAKQLLKGAAQLFIRSQANINSWAKLKRALLDEFSSDYSTADIHKILSAKKKRFEQSYLEFLYEILEISKPISLDEKSIIDYYIEGISDSRMNKMILYEATTIQELKNKIKIYARIKEGSNQQHFKGNNNQQTKKCIKCPHLYIN